LPTAIYVLGSRNFWAEASNSLSRTMHPAGRRANTPCSDKTTRYVFDGHASAVASTASVVFTALALPKVARVKHGTINNTKLLGESGRLSWLNCQLSSAR